MKTATELIGMLQMRSPGVENEIQAGGVNKGLDDIYLMYERQRKKYQEEIHQNMLQIMDLMDQYKACLFILSAINTEGAGNIKSNLYRKKTV